MILKISVKESHSRDKTHVGLYDGRFVIFTHKSRNFQRLQIVTHFVHCRSFWLHLRTYSYIEKLSEITYRNALCTLSAIFKYRCYACYMNT